MFDVLGKLEFEGQPLRDLLLKAIRYGEQPEVRARLDTAVDQALDRAALQDLLEERQLVHDAMDATRVQRVREEMERAEARPPAAALHRVVLPRGVPAARRRGAATGDTPLRGDARPGAAPETRPRDRGR